MRGLLGKAAISFAILSVVLLAIFVVTFVLPSKADSGSAIVWTGLPDYSPGMTVDIHGSGFNSNVQLLIKVTRPDNSNVTGDGSFGPWPSDYDYVTADSTGNFQYNYKLDGIVGQYLVEVLDANNNKIIASTTFTDGSVDVYDQCTNDLGAGYASGDTGCRWTNGNIQHTNSVYFEGDATVQQLSLTGFDSGTTHNVTFRYGTTKGGKHAYDFLTTWNWSESWITVADRCQGITGCEAASTESTFTIPDDTNVPNTIETFASGTRDLVMRGGTITAVSTPVIVSGDYTGDSDTAITVTFTVGPDTGAMCSTKGGATTCGVAIWFGAHVSSGLNWTIYDGTTGAGSISGSPYHVALTGLDGASIGSRDNQMQSNAIIPLSNITIHKVTSPSSDTTTTFHYTTTGTGYSAFDLTGGTQNLQGVAPGSYSLTESALTSWLVAGLTCTVSGKGTSATPNLGTSTVSIIIGSDGGSVVDCTYTNTLQQGTLIVIKHVVNDNGGSATADQFGITVTGSSPSPASFNGAESPGTNVTLNVGPYSVNETSGPSGYATSYSTDCSGSIAAGQTKTCIITNDDQPAHLIVIKHVVNDNGGNNAASGWNMTISGVTATGGNSFAGAESPGVNKTLTTVGSYDVTENSITGYTQTSASADCSGTIVLGQTKTCTITNDDQPAHITLIKNVTNNNGGTAGVNDFGIKIDGNIVSSGSTTDVNSNTAHTINENGLTGYAFVSIIGDAKCPAVLGGTVTLNEGESVNCTITNDDIQPKLNVTKIVVNDNGGTKVVSDFPLFVNATSVTSGVINGFDAGKYIVSETPQSGYTETIGGDCAADGSVTLNVGDVKNCTITNNDISPMLTVIKYIINDNGGTATLSSFTPLKVNATTVTNGTVTAFNAGLYVVTETNVSGYVATFGGDCNSSGAVTLSVGQNKNCTITNDDIQPKLTVTKIVHNLYGGTKVVADFTLKVNTTQVTSDQQNGFNVGTYTVSENPVFGYTGTISGDCTSNGQVSLSVGDVKACQIDNYDIQPKLIVIKHVVNSYGGTASSSSFTMSVSGSNPSPVSFSGQDSPGTNVSLNAGFYNVSETGPSGYAASYSSNCTGTISVGEVRTCTVTNNDIQPKLTVTKVVQNNHGGTLTASNFPLFVNATSVTSGAQNGFNVGFYNVSETQQTGYSLVGITGDCASNGSITLNVGDVKSCTITDQDIAPYLTIIKHVINDNGGNATANLWTMHVTATNPSSNDFSGAESPGTTITLNQGAYSADETSGPSGYAKSLSADCTGSISVGQNKTCTITNDDIQPKLIVIKHMINNNGGTATASSFTMSVTGSSPTPSSFNGAESPGTNVSINQGSYSVDEAFVFGYTKTLGTDCSGFISVGQTKTCTITNDDIPGQIKIIKNTLGGDRTFNFTITGPNSSTPSILTSGGTGNTGFITVNAGTYSASETVPAGWDLTGSSCDSGTPASFNVPLNGSITCTFNDTKRGHLIVQKTTYPAADPTVFTISASGTGTITGGGAGTITDALDKDYEVTPGTYNVTETVPAGWNLIGSNCTNVVVNAGEAKYCLLTNVKPDAKITLSPLTGNNSVNSPHQITATVMTDSGSGFVNALDGTLVTFSFSQNTIGAIFVGGINTCTTTGGSCSISINSSSPGTVKVHATTTLTVLNVSLTRQTDGLNGNSVDANKTYVNARISISGNATNEVGTSHTFTVTVEKDIGSGWTGISGVHPIVTLTPIPGTVTDNCATTGTNASGQCTVVVNSNVAGVFIASASANISVNGVPFALTTDGTSPSSGTATKTYVDAKISLTPSGATNNVNQVHTITATVMEDPGTGFVAASGELVTFSLLNNVAGATFVGVNTCTTNATGQCSVQINSSTPGSVDVHASVDVGVNSLTLHRETDGTHNSSSNANKVYVAGKIIVEKQTLPDGDSQSFEFDPSWSASNFSLTDGQQHDSGWLAPGTYSVAENVPTGWDQTSAICNDSSPVNAISLQAGETVTCIFTNTKKPKLTVTKIVVNDNGGTKVVADFPLFVNETSVTSGVQNIFTIGPHTVSETSDPGYAETIGGDCAANGSVTLAAGDEKTCTITNDDIQPKLIVIKHVINNDGGNKTSGDFSITVTGNSPSPSTFPGNESGTTVMLNVGGYSVDETSVKGYAKALSSDCSGTIAIGQTKTCTITNDDVKAVVYTHTSSQTVTLGGFVRDIVTVSCVNTGGSCVTPTGNVTFYVCSGTTCTTGGTQIGSAVQLVNGTATSDKFTPNTSGTYTFRVEYSGDANYFPAVDINTGGKETFTVVDSRRMTGGGSIDPKTLRITHGFELHCDITALPNNLEINWGKGNNFHLTSLTSAVCSYNTALGDPKPPKASFNTYVGTGTGLLNGVAGAKIEFTFTDVGEPGKKDTATYKIWDKNNNLVQDASGSITSGNQQAHG